MSRRKIFTLIILLGTLTQFVLGNFVFEDFPAIISYILLVPFYLIVYLYYQRNIFIKLVVFISTFTLLANLFMLDYLGDYSLYSNKVRLISMFSYIGCVINNILVLASLLKNTPKSKWIKFSFIVIVYTNFIFFSYYYFPFVNNLTLFFGTRNYTIRLTMYIANIFRLCMYAVVLIAQMIAINKLEKEEIEYLQEPK